MDYVIVVWKYYSILQYTFAVILPQQITMVGGSILSYAIEYTRTYSHFSSILQYIIHTNSINILFASAGVAKHTIYYSMSGPKIGIL